jgi:hypothetical protein
MERQQTSRSQGKRTRIRQKTLNNENNENVILCLFACLHETIDGYFSPPEQSHKAMRILRSNTVRVSREQRRKTNVRQTQPQHDNTLQTDTTTGMRRASVAESIDIIAQTL